MSGFKASGPFTLLIISFVILLSAGIIFSFYIINITNIVRSVYNIEYSTNLNAMGTEAVNILKHQTDGMYNMDLLGRDLSLESSNYLNNKIDYTLDNVHKEYDMMVDYDIGFFFRYGDSKIGSQCGVEPPSSFFDEKGQPKFTLSWPGDRPATDFGVITSLQGTRYIFNLCNCHSGMDFSFGRGENIYAVYSGMIEYADWHPSSLDDHSKSYGLFIRMKHWIGIDKPENIPTGDESSPDFYTYYGHLDEIPANIKEGIWVSSGDKIGTCGNTGISTGSHLHLEIRNSKKQSMNPCPFFEEQPRECQYSTSRKPTYCGDYVGADKITFDLPVPGAILKNGVPKTKAIGVLYKWE